MNNNEFFPDGTKTDSWFYEERKPNLSDFKNQYIITDYGVKDDGNVYTEMLQSVIDKAAQSGGVVVVPKGEYLTGALFFKEGVSLYIEEGATLVGSDDISDYPVMDTRIEGESCVYYPALINADNTKGFKLFGKGTIDGNGLKSWKAFWQRRQWNPDCTNKDEQRPRLVFVSNSTDVTIDGISLKNSHFWTTHFYKCQRVTVSDCSITSPREPVKAPSTDAIDLDVCKDVLIKGCYFDVNDDGVALKGGKGPWADTLAENGMNERIIIQDCTFKFCHGCLTCGSEAIHNKNIIVRNSVLDGPATLLWLKMRLDTPQHYEYIRIENVNGYSDRMLSLYNWNQFFDLKGREGIPVSYADHIEFSDCNLKCKSYFDMTRNDEYYRVSDVTFKNLNIETIKDNYVDGIIDNIRVVDSKIFKQGE